MKSQNKPWYRFSSEPKEALSNVKYTACYENRILN